MKVIRVVSQALAGVGAGLVILLALIVIINRGNLPTVAEITSILGSSLGQWLLISLAIDAFVAQWVFRDLLSRRTDRVIFFITSICATMMGMVVAGFLATLIPNLSMMESIERGEKTIADAFAPERMTDILLICLIFWADSTTNGWFIWIDKREGEAKEQGG